MVIDSKIFLILVVILIIFLGVLGSVVVCLFRVIVEVKIFGMIIV